MQAETLLKRPYVIKHCENSSQKQHPERPAGLCYLKCGQELQVVARRHLGWRLDVREDSYTLQCAPGAISDWGWLVGRQQVDGQASFLLTSTTRATRSSRPFTPAAGPCCAITNRSCGKLLFTVISSYPFSRGRLSPAVGWLWSSTRFQYVHLICIEGGKGAVFVSLDHPKPNRLTVTGADRKGASGCHWRFFFPINQAGLVFKSVQSEGMTKVWWYRCHVPQHCTVHLNMNSMICLTHGVVLQYLRPSFF